MLMPLGASLSLEGSNFSGLRRMSPFSALAIGGNAGSCGIVQRIGLHGGLIDRGQAGDLCLGILGLAPHHVPVFLGRGLDHGIIIFLLRSGRH